jgi:hypothetical protein
MTALCSPTRAAPNTGRRSHHSCASGVITEFATGYPGYDGGGIGKGATETLLVEGNQVAQGQIARTVPIHFSLDETLDVGEDRAAPVVEDYVDKMPYRFFGTSRSSSSFWNRKN